MIDSASYSLLKIFSDKSPLSLHEISDKYHVQPEIISDSISFLLENKYIRKNALSENIESSEVYLRDSFSITFKGMVAIEEYKKYRRRFLFSEFRLWITLVISILALIISAISLILQTV